MSENTTYVMSNYHRSHPTIIRINPNESDIPEYLIENHKITCLAIPLGGLEALMGIKEYNLQ